MTEEAAISDKELDPNSTRGKIARFSSLLSQQIKNNWQQNYPPESRKHLRSFSSSEVSDLIGIAPATLRQMSLDNEGPQPARSDGNRRMYTLDQINELRSFLAEKRPGQSLQFDPRRRKEDGMQIVAIANFKGGCAKTTTALHLAQFLALQGLRVLAIDLDTQASLTEMLGVQPVLEVGDNETVFGVLRYDDERRPLPEVIRPTYFAGLDLVPGQSELQYFDYETPAAIISNKYVGDEYFIRRLATALRSVEDRYDVVVIDAPPQLSYLTLNAVFAATGLIIPVQSAMIDVASMNQFLYMMDEMLEQMAHFGAPVDHEFMRFLLTRHIPHDVPQVNIAAMLRSLFGESVLTAAVVETTAITNAGLENKTLYELEKGSVGRDTYNRAIESVNAANTEIFQEILKVWGRS
ncbi:MAG: plasmid partitioning protein RepA [Roseibium aggregatum]|jgi:chromosome partitioning protein|uniref:plasmid partitioning protein RepA n=1 Tax=uncultured Roseibium sp. TaxID=1936171 RepID=UPI0026288C0D|nr:plasmid partitioning protein RepA [uncultured Roseibium sp.]